MTETPPTPEFPERMNAFITTEHFTLQSARSIVNGEIANRVNIYFTTLSSVLIASAFLAQIRTMEYLFRLFLWVAIPVTVVLGLFTFARLIVLSNMDFTYIRAINRIRHFYVQATPDVERYMLFPAHDDDRSTRTYGGYVADFRGNLLSAANTVQVANSIVATVALSVLISVSIGMATVSFLPYGLVIFAAVYPLHGVLGLQLAKMEFRPEYREARFPARPLDARERELN